MSQNLTNLYSELKNRASEFIDTAYFTNDSSFNQSRRRLIEDSADSPIFREPTFEPIKRYVESGLSASDLIAGLGIKDLHGHDAELTKKFLESFDPVKFGSLYRHQADSIFSALSGRENFVVTTGTGSGKSFCFQIPLVMNLLSEALGSGGRRRWNQASLSNSSWWQNPRPRFEPKRVRTQRTAAVRALIMYPLNALVQDQVDGLRSILNSQAAENLYSKVFGGDRIYFGQYSGSTIGRGSLHPRRVAECARQMKQIEASIANPRGGQLDPSIQTLSGSELITRWDMQQFPPDILITNYSMLSIMLLREREQRIFEETKEWLASDRKNNRFYLVIDELHSYRGTGGTEISYIIRSFIDRLGLSPDDPQLQIIATSASLSPENGQKFLSEFFGTDSSTRPFKVINGPIADVDAASVKRVKDGKSLFADFARSSATEQELVSLVNNLAIKTGIQGDDEKSKIEKIGFHDALLTIAEEARLSHPESDRLTSYPLRFEEIAKYLFDGDESAARGFLISITSDFEATKQLRAKTRMHLFVRNLDGIRRSMATSNGKLIDPILYDGTRPICSRTGAINLDTYYCQECGELYYFGYRNLTADRTFVTNDDSLDPTLRPDGIVLHIPRGDVQYVHAGWENRFFNGFTGELSQRHKPGLISVFMQVVQYAPASRKHALPNVCVHCEANWTTKPINKSPIRSMGTGYNKFSQVIIEQLVGSLREVTSNDFKSSKIVIFSDSRRDAAIISADLELNHYRDTVRALTEKHLSNATSINTELVNFIKDLELAKASESWVEIQNHPYRKKDSKAFRDLRDYFKGDLDKHQDVEAWQNAESLIISAKSPLVRLFGEGNSLVQLVLSDLIETGMNPAGIYSEDQLTWQDIFLRQSPTVSQDVLRSRQLARERFVGDVSFLVESREPLS